MQPRLARNAKILRAALLLVAALQAAPAWAAQTATVSGTPALHTGPGTEFAATGKTLPAGATVTVEGCDSGMVPGAGAWCLVRGAGWVAAEGLVNLSADPQDLLPGGLDPLDALGDSTPSWDDPTRQFNDPAD